MRYAWNLPRVVNNQDQTLSNRVRTISRYYVDWLSNVQSLQTRFIENASADRSSPDYLSDRQRALADLNRALAETESLTARLGSLASDLEVGIEQLWPAIDSPCLYPGSSGTMANRRWNFNRSTSASSSSEMDYEGMLKEGRLDKNGCEVPDWHTGAATAPGKHMMEAER